MSLKTIELPGGVKAVLDPTMAPDEFILGYRDGKGGWKPGAVKGKLSRPEEVFSPPAQEEE